MNHEWCGALSRDELIDLLHKAVAENERLLRACHAQRDRARKAEKYIALIRELAQDIRQIRVDLDLLSQVVEILVKQQKDGE
jgi:hypothetical protein